MKLSLWIAIVVFAAGALPGATYCSLSVEVRTPTGAGVEARVEAKVEVEEADGTKTEQQTFGGIASFCDLGITPVTVTVGHPACNQVVVRNVPVGWQQTRHLKVTYDEAACLEDSMAVAACSFLLRFSKEAHASASTVSLSMTKPSRETRSADDFGRILVSIVGGQDLVGIASAAGYQPVPIQIPCVRKNRFFEQRFVMEKNGY